MAGNGISRVCGVIEVQKQPFCIFKLVGNCMKHSLVACYALIRE